MTEETQADATTKTVRGRRYPGASLDDVLAATRHIDAAGGTISVGRLAVRVGKSEKSSAFERLTATMVSFGLVQWQGKGSGMLDLTEDGRAALSGDDDVRGTALRAAFVRPEIFAAVTRRFRGRALNDDDVAEGFLAAGVAPEASAQTAAKIFIESARTAGAAHDEGGRLILDGDLPIEERESSSPRPAAGVRRPEPPTPGVRRTADSSPKADPIDPIILPAPQAAAITLQLDVSGWDVDKVVDLVRKLREPVPGA